MKQLIRTIIAFATIFSVSTFAAEKVYMPPVGTTNIHSDYGIAAQKLMKTYIEDDGRFVLVEGTATDSVDINNYESVKNKATAKGCSKVLLAEFTRLGDNVILSFKFYNTSSDTPIWQDRLKAANPDDFDPIIQRVARNIGTEEKATTDQDIYNVTENETKLPKRKKVNSYFGVGIGGMVPLSPVVDMDPGFVLFGMYDTQSLLFGIDLDLWGLSDDSRYNDVDIGISLYYPFGRKFIAPYVGGGITYSSVSFNSDVKYRTTESSYDYDIQEYKTRTVTKTSTYSYEKTGIGMYAGGGVMVNRASSIALFIEAKYFVNFYKLEQPMDEVTENEWNAYDSWDSKDLPSKKSKLFQGFTFDVKIGYGF